MSSHVLQRFERATKAIGQILGHSEGHDHICLLLPVSMLGHSGERHANDAFFVNQFGEEIDVEGLNAIVEDNNPFPLMLGLAYGPGHRFSIRKTVEVVA